LLADDPGMDALLAEADQLAADAQDPQKVAEWEREAREQQAWSRLATRRTRERRQWLPRLGHDN
jgi:hypothetical protein